MSDAIPRHWQSFLSMRAILRFQREIRNGCRWSGPGEKATWRLRLRGALLENCLVDLLKEEEDASIVEGNAGEGPEAARAGSEQIGFSERAVKVVAAAHEALVHRVRDRHPFHDEMTPGEAVTEGKNCRQRDLLHEDEVMDDRQHEHEVEPGFETRQQGNRLLVLPADGWSGTREVRLDGLDGETRSEE